MRYTLLILFIFQLSFSQTIDKSNLLKEIDETHDNGKPKKVDYKNFDLKVVLTETYDESGDITSSYQLNPETGKRNGEFFDFPLKNLYPEGFKNYDGSFDFENPKNVGEYDEGVLIKCDNCTFYMYEERGEYHNYDYSSSKLIYSGKVNRGRLIGKINVYKLFESTTTIKNEHGSRIFSQDLGRPVTLYMETGSGVWSKQHYYSFSFNEKGFIDDGVIKFYRNFDENSLSRITYKNNIVSQIINYKGHTNEPKDSIGRFNKIWKIDNKFVKNNGWYLGPRFDPLDIHRFVSNIDDFSEYSDYTNFKTDEIFYNQNCESKTIQYVDDPKKEPEYDYCYKSSIGNLVFFGSKNSVIKDSDINGYFRYYPNGRYYSDYGDGGDNIYSFFDLIRYNNLDSNGVYSYYNNGVILDFLKQKEFSIFLQNYSRFEKIIQSKDLNSNKQQIKIGLDIINSINIPIDFKLYDYNKKEGEVVFNQISFPENIDKLKVVLTEQLNSLPDFKDDFYSKIISKIGIINKLSIDLIEIINTQNSNYSIKFVSNNELKVTIFQNKEGCKNSSFEKILEVYTNNFLNRNDNNLFFETLLDKKLIRLSDINQNIYFGNDMWCGYDLYPIQNRLKCLINYVELIGRYSQIDKSKDGKKFNRFLNKTFDVYSWSSSLKQNGIDLDKLIKEDVCKLNDEMKFLEKQIDLFIEKNN